MRRTSSSLTFSTASFAMTSQSITETPSSTSLATTVDFPDAMLPVRPQIRIGTRARGRRGGFFLRRRNRERVRFSFRRHILKRKNEKYALLLRLPRSKRTPPAAGPTGFSRRLKKNSLVAATGRKDSAAAAASAQKDKGSVAVVVPSSTTLTSLPRPRSVIPFVRVDGGSRGKGTISRGEGSPSKPSRRCWESPSATRGSFCLRAPRQRHRRRPRSSSGGGNRGGAAAGPETTGTRSSWWPSRASASP